MIYCFAMGSAFRLGCNLAIWGSSSLHQQEVATVCRRLNNGRSVPESYVWNISLLSDRHFWCIGKVVDLI